MNKDQDYDIKITGEIETCDFSDVEERVRYYHDHPEEAKAIIEHAHEYVAQFMDKQREDLISLAVLNKYFKMV